MHLNETSKYTLAKSFTELAIQNGLINQYADSADTAKEVTTFSKQSLILLIKMIVTISEATKLLQTPALRELLSFP